MKESQERRKAKVPPKCGCQAGRAYEPPRIAKKRAVSQATLFTGSGPDAGGVIGTNG